MKKIYNICLVLFLVFAGQQALAQRIGDLKGIHFQAVAIDDNGKEIVGMDINGKPVYNKTIGVRFSILKGNNGPVQYQETHSTLTDAHGLFSLVIGSGKQTGSGEFTKLLDLPWIDADQFLRVEISLKNDENYKMVSLQQFMAVPYSFYTDDIADDAITTAKILNEEILAEDIKEGAVETSEILNETILSEDIKNETILAEDIAEGAVTTSEILNGTIINEDIAANAVTSNKIQDGTIVNADIANATIDLTAKVTNVLPVVNGGTGAATHTSGSILVGNGTDAVKSLGQAADGQIPIGVTGGDPVLGNITAGTGIVVTNTAGGIEISSGVKGINTQETGIVTVGAIAAGANFVTQVTLEGVAPGDFVVASFSNPLQGCLMSGYVRNNNQIEVAIFNANTTQKNLGKGTFKVLVIK